MTQRKVRKQEWVFPLFSSDSDDRLSLNFHRFVMLYISCDTQSVGLGQYCLLKVYNGFKKIDFIEPQPTITTAYFNCRNQNNLIGLCTKWQHFNGNLNHDKCHGEQLIWLKQFFIYLSDIHHRSKNTCEYHWFW